MRREAYLLLCLPFVTGCPAFLTLNRIATPGLQSGNGDSNGGRLATYDKLPDTSTGRAVYAFSDQPAQSNPLDKTVRFAATHFAGTQKMTAEEKARFVDVNPNWVQLHYRLGVASGPAEYIHGDRWASDFSDVTSHADWFLRDSNSARSETTAANGSWDLHNLWSNDFRHYWLDNVSNDLQANDSDGVFADSFMGGIGCALLDTGKCDARLQGTGAGDVTKWANGVTWIAELNDWSDTIQSALHALPGKPLLLPNLDALNTFWAVQLLRLATYDGAFLENFPYANQDADYVAANNNALVLTSADKFVILQDSIDAASASQRSFVIGTYLLLKGKRTFLNLIGGSGDTGFYYWPEYDVDLGTAVTPLPADFGTLRWGAVYRRDFANGIVLVNGSASGTVVTLPSGTNWYQVVPTGGGAVSELQLDAAGGLAGQSLSYNAVSSLSLPAWSGAILLNERP